MRPDQGSLSKLTAEDGQTHVCMKENVNLFQARVVQICIEMACDRRGLVDWFLSDVACEGRALHCIRVNVAVTGGRRLLKYGMFPCLAEDAHGG